MRQAGREGHRFAMRAEPGTDTSWERAHSVRRRGHALCTYAGMRTHRLPPPPQMLSQHPASPHPGSLELFSWSSGGQHLLQSPSHPSLSACSPHCSSLSQAFPTLQWGVWRCGSVPVLQAQRLEFDPNVIKVEVVVYAGYRAGEAGTGQSLGHPPCWLASLV